MKINDFIIVKSRAVKFSWKLHRLVKSPPIYHWLWFTFSFYPKDKQK